MQAETKALITQARSLLTDHKSADADDITTFGFLFGTAFLLGKKMGFSVVDYKRHLEHAIKEYGTTERLKQSNDPISVEELVDVGMENVPVPVVAIILTAQSPLSARMEINSWIDANGR